MNKHHLERVVVKWLNQHFGNLTPKTTKKYSDSIFYVDLDNKVIMEYDEKNDVWINYYQIWLKIESIFGLNYADGQYIIKIWLKKTYNIESIELFRKI